MNENMLHALCLCSFSLNINDINIFNLLNCVIYEKTTNKMYHCYDNQNKCIECLFVCLLVCPEEAIDML